MGWLDARFEIAQVAASREATTRSRKGLQALVDSMDS